MSAIHGLQAVFRPLVFWTRFTSVRSDQSDGFHGTVNLDFGDGAPGWHLVFADEGMRCCHGSDATPIGTVSLSPELFLDLLAGRANYSTAEMTGRVRVTGDGHCRMIVPSIVGRIRNRARQKGIRGWLVRRFLRRAMRKGGKIWPDGCQTATSAAN